MSLLHKSIKIIKYSSIFGVSTGFSIGLWLNMDIMLKYKNVNIINKTKLPICIIGGGLMGIMAPISIILIPFGLVNYIFNFPFIDRKYDNIRDKYNITLERYYQYGVLNTKYDYPSNIIINIEKNSIKIKKNNIL